MTKDPDPIASREYALWASNNFNFYERWMKPYAKAISKKLQKGTFLPHKMLQGIANNISKPAQEAYFQEFGLDSFGAGGRAPRLEKGARMGIAGEFYDDILELANFYADPKDESEYDAGVPDLNER